MNNLLTKNVEKFYLKLNEFRERGQFTDVTIECADGALFKCHRLALLAASNFFCTMFYSDFNERASETISLGEWKGTTFRQVLNFIYTGGGNVRINSTNAYDLLRASDFFDLSDLQDMCVSFVKKNVTSFTIRDFLYMYMHAHRIKIDALTEVLKRHIVNQFEIFSKADEFCEIEFDALNPLITSRLKLPPSRLRNADEILLGAITRWICYQRQDRRRYFNQLTNMVKFGNISFEFTQVMHPDQSIRVDAARPRTIPSISQLRVPRLVAMKNNCVYVRYARENLIRIFNVTNSFKDYYLCGEISISELGHHRFRTVALNDFLLYRLNYYPGLETFSGEHNMFYVHTSADMGRSSPLKSPPIVFKEVSLCTMRNRIYAYNKSLYQNVRTGNLTQNSSTLDDSEIARRGIYAYNFEVDNWFAIPEMKKTLACSSIATINGILYLVGGKGYTFVRPTKNYVQAYDPRAPQWIELRSTEKCYESALCWTQNDKLIVGGGLRTNGCERYDPVAGRWESILSRVNATSMSYLAMSDKDTLWLLDQTLIPENCDPSRFLNYQSGTIINGDQCSNSSLRSLVGGLDNFTRLQWKVCQPVLRECVHQFPTEPTNIVESVYCF